MTSLIDFPLLLMVAILPLTWIAAALLWARAPRRELVSAHVLVIAGSAILIAFILTLLWLALLYLFSSGFTAPIGPTTTVITRLYELAGPDSLAIKLLGFGGLLICLALLALAVWQRFRRQWLACVVALGYFSLLVVSLSPSSVASVADWFLTAASAFGLYACLLRPGRVAWLLCGIALGIAMNSHNSGIIFFLPYLAWFFERDGYRAPLVILLAAAVTALLPFLLLESGPAGLSSVRIGADFTPALLRQFADLFFIVVPVLAFLLWQWGSVGIRSWLVRRRFVSAVAVMTALLALVVFAGADSQSLQFLPFLPGFALLTTYALSDVYAYRPTTAWSVYGFWAPLTAFLAAAVIVSLSAPGS